MSSYPKKFMRLTELVKMGLPKEWLYFIYRSRSINRDYSIAWKMDFSKSNSPIIFDTEELEKYRKAQCTGV